MINTKCGYMLLAIWREAGLLRQATLTKSDRTEWHNIWIRRRTIHYPTERCKESLEDTASPRHFLLLPILAYTCHIMTERPDIVACIRFISLDFGLHNPCLAGIIMAGGGPFCTEYRPISLKPPATTDSSMRNEINIHV